MRPGAGDGGVQVAAGLADAGAGVGDPVQDVDGGAGRQRRGDDALAEVDSPFTFYRGAALPMARDLSRTPVSGLAVQACGDAHLSNFGIFGSAERRLVFDVNDFSETTPGPWEWGGLGHYRTPVPLALPEPCQV